MAMTPAERQRAFRERQKLKMAQDSAYAAEIKAKRAASDKAYRAKRDSETYNAYMRAWYASKTAEGPEYREQKAAATRKWRAENPEKAADSYKVWAEKNDRSEYNLTWSRENSDKRVSSVLRRRAIIRGAPSSELINRQDIWHRDSGICGICQEEANPEDWHLDHVIPLSKGGSHTWDNVQVSHPKCNLSKGAKIFQ